MGDFCSVLIHSVILSNFLSCYKEFNYLMKAIHNGLIRTIKIHFQFQEVLRLAPTFNLKY